MYYVFVVNELESACQLLHEAQKQGKGQRSRLLDISVEVTSNTKFRNSPGHCHSDNSTQQSSQVMQQVRDVLNEELNACTDYKEAAKSKFRAQPIMEPNHGHKVQ
eukprot:m.159779 g.159779  ORF g.159779 m.159779 type:complete len:105 (-) comp14342_c0_seq26:3274-3588(-)